MTTVRPEVGMGATVHHWTDRSAATVVRVSESGKTVWLVEDIATRTDSNGLSESQTYEYAPAPAGAGREYVARLTSRGWRAGGRPVTFGARMAYRDPSF